MAPGVRFTWGSDSVFGHARVSGDAVLNAKTLNGSPMAGIGFCRMMERRLKAAKLLAGFSPWQHLAGHADPRTIRLYDRRRRKVTRNIVERISIDLEDEEARADHDCSRTTGP